MNDICPSLQFSTSKADFHFQNYFAMQTDIIATFFARDLDKLADEIRAFPTEASLWQTAGTVKNSAGTLALHLIGNLNHFIGATLGGTGYVRQRDREFADRDVPRDRLLMGLAATKELVVKVLGKIPDAQLAEPFPLDHFGAGKSYLHALLHLLAHLDYHLGQVNYLRRVLEQG